MIKVKETKNNDTTSLIFYEDLFTTNKIVKLVKLLKFKTFCFEAYFLTKQDLNLLKLLELNSIDYKIFKINRTQNKILINCFMDNLENIVTIINQFHFEEINLWDQKISVDNSKTNKAKPSKFYLNFNKMENNLTEIIFNNKTYETLNKELINIL